MGFWYFLILLLGLFLVVKGLFMHKPSLFVKKISFLLVGLLCMSLALFMFLPGSAEIIAELLNLE
ncbi:hypothetical protein FOH38_18690 [Lysinibacillus fusiformis]|nr:hypothetical protein FOH38_18690 [Lysinibacillus fusiformis]